MPQSRVVQEQNFLGNEAPRQKPTIKDVARASGASVTAVSYVLNNSRTVGVQTRERVLAAAQELGYRPNPLARGLITGRTQAFGTLVRDLQSYITTRIIAGVEKAAREQGYKMLLAPHNQDPSQAVSALHDLTARRMDGIISISGNSDEHPEIIAALPAAGLPYVLAFYRPSETARADSVVVDNRQGGYVATRHLLDLGRRRIAFVGGPAANNASRERLKGYRQAHAEMDLTPDEALIVSQHFMVEGGMRAAEQLLRDGVTPPDAVFACNDHIAAGFIRGCREKGLRVPDDVAVVGFDDHDMCPALDPPLTSMRMPLPQVGQLCVERLIYRLEQGAAWEPETITLPCSLVIRQSA